MHQGDSVDTQSPTCTSLIRALPQQSISRSKGMTAFRQKGTVCVSKLLMQHYNPTVIIMKLANVDSILIDSQF